MPSASSCFLHVFGFRKVTQKSSSEKIKKITKIIFHRKSPGARRAGPTEPHKAWATLGRGPGGGCALLPPLPSDTASRRRFALFIPSSRNRRNKNRFPEKRPEAPPPSNPSFGSQKAPPRHPAGTGIGPRSHLHRRCCLHDAS